MKQAEEMKCNVGFLDPQIFLATMVQFKSNDVIQAIKKAMKHNYVVGALLENGPKVLAKGTSCCCSRY